MAVAAARSYGVRQLPVSVPVIIRRNELLVSPDGLIEDGLLRASDCTGNAFSATTIDYDTVIPFKHRLLKTAWTTFRSGARRDLRPDYEQFCDVHRHWLEDYALFRALKAAHNGAYYLEWPAELVRRTPAALAEARRSLGDQVDQLRFAQFLAFRQAGRVRDHAHTKGVRLIGDLPFLFPPTQAMCGPTRSCFCSTNSTSRALSLASLPTISAPRGSSGATRYTTGTLFAGAATDGA